MPTTQLRLIALVLTALLAPALTIDVRPRVLFANGSVSVVCRVPKAPERRWLEIGVEPRIQVSGHQVDKDSPTLWIQEFHHIPCEATGGFCAIGTGKDPSEVAVMLIQVAGCDER